MTDSSDLLYSMPLRDLRDIIPPSDYQILESSVGDQIAGDYSRVVCIKPESVRRVLQSCGVAFEPRVLVFSNLKGGVGKTTSAVSVGSRAAQYGYKTCILDLDAQGSAGLAMGILPGEDDLVFNDIWQAPQANCGRAIRQIQPGFGLVPSGLENSLLDVSLVNPASQKTAVMSVCREIQAQGYELIIVDCPPSLGTAVISAVCAADLIVVPAGNDALSFRGIELTVEEAGTIRDTFGLPELPVRILLTRVDRRQKLAGEYDVRVREAFPGCLLEPGIRTSTEIPRSLEAQATVFASSRQTLVKEEYDAVTRALLDLNISGELPVELTKVEAI